MNHFLGIYSGIEKKNRKINILFLFNFFLSIDSGIEKDFG